VYTSSTFNAGKQRTFGKRKNVRIGHGVPYRWRGLAETEQGTG
jgi:hypothetical protein